MSVWGANGSKYERTFGTKYEEEKDCVPQGGSEPLCLYYGPRALGDSWRKVLAKSLGSRGLGRRSSPLATVKHRGPTKVALDGSDSVSAAAPALEERGLLTWVHECQDNAKTMPSLGIARSCPLLLTVIPLGRPLPTHLTRMRSRLFSPSVARTSCWPSAPVPWCLVAIACAFFSLFFFFFFAKRYRSKNTSLGSKKK
ncbi:hypothetical protein GQ53DRAFT_40410 [Thozetella sp. PMI_491]|nr:hypothetical protein GQ53DRAFT_40410 [Thozetella sp. PMI_491]